MPERDRHAEMPPLHVIATAGHVDHGKSSLVLRLTGIDPDRWEEEKRRGLTIDLGFAWTTLPSGREVGFVDVPGHERFVRNMLAGVGPVRLVLFVVAADEGWKPQSEEHLEIVDVLGAHGGVVALTKVDAVDPERVEATARDVRAHLEGTALAEARVVACSAVTGTGLDALREALDDLVAGAPPPEGSARARLSIDRSFTIRGAGTVVTGTLTGGPLRVGQEVRIYPDGETVRIRSLQTHRRSVETARPVSRVAVNLAGVTTQDVERGDVLAEPGRWRPTSAVEARVYGVRSLTHAVTSRGAFKLYTGSAERDARLRVYDTAELRAGGVAFARITLSRPILVELGDRFVIREAGRRETVAGGVVLDAHPPPRRGDDAVARLALRASIAVSDLPALIVRERRAVRVSDLASLTGIAPSDVEGVERAGSWWIDGGALADIERAARELVGAYHEAHPLRRGMDASELVRALPDRVKPRLATLLERDLAPDALAALERSGALAREGTLLRLPEHRVAVSDRDAARLIGEVEAAEPTPPTVPELVARGYPTELIDACVAEGRLVGISTSLIVTPRLSAEAERVAREEASSAEGLTVSRFRKRLGTTRKYALPLLEWLDGRGITKREGDVRLPG